MKTEPCPAGATAHPEARSSTWFTLFGYGFRPFFLFAGLSAPALMAVWLLVLTGTITFGGSVAVTSWHAHEMLFGFASAAIAGFLLTAIPSWTGTKALSGAPLAGLAALWLAGRFASLPPVADCGVAAVVDLAFFPALAAVVAIPLIRAGKWRNTPFLALLALLAIGNLLFRLEWLGLTADSAARGIALVTGVVLMMVAVIGGRIVPAFTRNALKMRGDTTEIRPAGIIDPLALGTTAAMVALDVAVPGSALSGVLAVGAAMAHALRLAGWRSDRTLGQPMLWSLHLGYAWVPVALVLKAAWLLGGIGSGATWLHALTIGTFATMILAVMSRAALGHTGRAIVAPRATVAAYGLVTLAALARIVAPLLPAEVYGGAITAAGLLWTAAFVLFVWDYAPILLRPRVDGRPG